MAEPTRQRGRPGRPKDADSAETRRRILHAGRRLFAELGYAGASNRSLAEAAGLTTGAIYHYFDSKLDVYVAVYADASENMAKRLIAAFADCPTFIGALAAMLQEAHQLNIEDPSLARFVASCRLDIARNARLAEATKEAGSERAMWDQLIEKGLQSGEIDAANQLAVRSLLQTVALGLTVLQSDDIARHRATIDATLALFEGKLVSPPVVD